MKSKLAALIIATTIFIGSAAMAGPYHSAVIVGSSATTEDLTIDVPAKKAIAITNFTDSNTSGSKSTVTATINGSTATILNATLASQDSGEQPPFNREVIVVGPATVAVNAATGQTAFISYRIFAN